MEWRLRKGGEKGQMVEVLKALAEENRLRILALLLQGELCVCDIEESLGMTQSNVSRHLNILRKSGILETSKKAQWVYYKVSDSFAQQNGQLWLYLQQKLQELPGYRQDLEALQKRRELEGCSMGSR